MNTVCCKCPYPAYYVAEMVTHPPLAGPLLVADLAATGRSPTIHPLLFFLATVTLTWVNDSKIPNIQKTQVESTGVNCQFFPAEDLTPCNTSKCHHRTGNLEPGMETSIEFQTSHCTPPRLRIIFVDIVLLSFNYKVENFTSQNYCNCRDYSAVG